LVSPRQPKNPKDDDSTPDSISVTSGSGASVDNFYGIYQRLTTIESQVGFIAAAVEDSKTKIEAIAKDVIETKAKFDILRPIGKTIAKGIWAVFIVLVTSLVGFGLTVLGMWLKHHYGW
jgi:hypothetical protein